MKPARCLILACGNTLRGDDGIGPFLAEWAEERFASQPEVQVICRQQWSPELAEDIARAQFVLFIDCSIDTAPGSVALTPVIAAASAAGLATHHLGAAELIALSRDLYHCWPPESLLLTVGAGAIELGEFFSDAVRGALPQARRLIEESVLDYLSSYMNPPR
jgi:hydrogenase maturation protease